MNKKTITKSVHTKAFETATIKIEAPSIYTVQQVGQRFVVCINGVPCNKQGQQAEDIGQVFTYRNEKLAFECLAFFRRCKL
jgi:hypothetical protein